MGDPNHILLNAFTQCAPCPQAKGQWRNPADRSSPGYRDVDYWIEVAQILDRGMVDALFFADIHGVYDVYGGSRDAGVRHAVQFPGNDPTVLFPLLAHETAGLGFIATYSTTYYPPFHTAKLFSSLDHFTGGRVGWNIVTSYLDSAYRNGLGGDPLGHDARYDQAEEYLQVVEALWEYSWEADAVVLDAAADMHTDPAKVHAIDHVGDHYSVQGPHMCEPSPQRTPFLVQAGTSPRGIEFAGRHAEAMFVARASGSRPRATKEAIVAATEAAGRAPDSIKLLSAISLVVAETDAEVAAKVDELRQYGSPQGAFALFGGWTGVDLAPYGPRESIRDFDSSGIQSVSGILTGLAGGPHATFGDLADAARVAGMHRFVAGTPEQIADHLEETVEVTGVDGFNVMPVVSPGGFEDLVDLVIPELQRRGRFRTRRADYDAVTLRERFSGRPHLPPDHPGATRASREPTRGAGTPSRVRLR